MIPVVVTTTDPDGWWWGGAGVLAHQGTALVSVTMPTFVAATAFAVHLPDGPHTELEARFAAHPYDFDGLAVERGADDLPLLTAVPRRLHCHVARTVTTDDVVRVYGVPAELGQARAA